MTLFQSLIAALAAIALFAYGLQGLSREMQAVGGTALQGWLGRVTESRGRGFLVGVLATVIVQSSSAITSLTVALVESGVISFRASLAVMLGANLGTTTTAWMISFKLAGIGPFMIVAGTAVSLMPARVQTLGKAIFYFGLVLFALDLMARELKPLQDMPLVASWLAASSVPWKAVIFGAVLTAVIQSSSVTTGLGVLMVQQGVLAPEAAIPLVIGANIGSTTTALIASLGMGAVARRAARVNTLFNLTGLLLFLPFLTPFSALVLALAGEPDRAVALAHLLFNAVVCAVCLALLPYVTPWLERRLSSAA